MRGGLGVAWGGPETHAIATGEPNKNNNAILKKIKLE